MLIQRRYAYRGIDLVVIPGPDGSVACLPAWMTHEAAAHFKLSAEPFFPLEILRSLREEAHVGLKPAQKARLTTLVEALLIEIAASIATAEARNE